jgi:hypothetical protein
MLTQSQSVVAWAWNWVLYCNEKKILIEGSENTALLRK